MRHDTHHSHSTCDELESLLLVGALLWLALSVLRWLLRHPRLWPLIALVWLVAALAR